MAGISRKTLLKQVRFALASRRSNKIRYIAPDTMAELKRIHDLRASGPLPIKAIDVRLAYKGWAEIYDDEPGNESIDYTHPCSMEAAEKLSRAEKKIYRLR